MFKNISNKLSRRRLNTKATGSYIDHILHRPNPDTGEGLAHRSAGCVEPSTSGAPKAAFFSAAGLNAHDPATDLHTLKADSQHLFAAVLNSKTSARGGHYLRQHIYAELLARIRQHSGDVRKALQEAVAHLNKTFRNLHPFNPEVLEGIQMSIVYVDFASSMLYIASNGACRCVVGRTSIRGHVQVVADVGYQEQPEGHRKDGLEDADITSVELTHDVDSIVLGSPGFWQEVAPFKSVLRLRHYFESAPKANQGSAAAHLTNLALHHVTRRVRGSPDPRMRSLRSVNNLLSLHAGEKSQFKWGDRQPVRRRRGDVHGDMTAVVFRLDWEGKQGSFKEQPKKFRQVLQEPPAAPMRGYSHWDLVRLHFRDFARESRQHTEQQWWDLVHQVLEQRPLASCDKAKHVARATSKLQSVSMSVRAGVENDQSTLPKTW